MFDTLEFKSGRPTTAGPQNAMRGSARAATTAPWAAMLSATVMTTALAVPAFADDVCPKRGGVLRTVDPTYNSLEPGERQNPAYFITLIYDALLDVEPDLSLRPGLASEMPKKVDDLTYEVPLREGVEFHDGTPFNAEAVKFNVERLSSGEVPSPFSKNWEHFVNNVEVVDDHTVRFHLAEPWPAFERELASSLRIASPTAVEKLGDDYGLKGAVGTGPFVFEEFTPRELIKLTRNDNYYREGEPCLDGFEARNIESGSVRLLSVKSGEVDLINTFPESQFPQLAGDENVIVEEGEATTLTVLATNTKNPALADKRVRQAIQHAVDGETIIRNVYRGAGKAVESIFPPWHPAFRQAEDLSPVRPDLDEARELLAEAGYGPDGEALTITLQTVNAGAHIQRGVLIQAMLKEVGIEVKLENISSGQVLTNMRSGNYDLALWQFLGGPTITDYTWNLYGSGSSQNFSFYNEEGGYQNERASEFLAEIVKSNDPEAISDELDEFQSVIFEDVPYIYVNFRNHRTARQSYVKNFATGKLKGGEDIRRVWLDK